MGVRIEFERERKLEAAQNAEEWAGRSMAVVLRAMARVRREVARFWRSQRAKKRCRVATMLPRLGRIPDEPCGREWTKPAAVN